MADEVKKVSGFDAVTGFYEGVWDTFTGAFKGPELPKAAEPDPAVYKGEEGIRRGVLERESKKRSLGQLHITRGQNRTAGLGGTQAKLGS